MKFITQTWLVLLLAVPALANPVVLEKVSLDMGTGTSCVWPEEGEVVTATIYILPGETLAQVVMDSIRIRLDRTFGGELLGLTNLTGGWHGGDPESPSGWLLDVPYCPPAAAHGFLAIGTVEYLYRGPPGLLSPRISSPQTDTAWVGCSGSHPGFLSRLIGGVGMSPPAGCYTPVDATSWGVIKALYRPQ